VIIRFGDFKILVRTVGIEKRRAEPHLHNVLAKSFQEINRPGNPRILTKSYQPAVAIISDLFIVDEPDVVFKHYVQCRHVVRLCLKNNDTGYLDCMRKEHESGVGDELIDRNLLDTDDQVALAEVLADYGALLLVLVV
jgi:hypothetical protein